MIDSYLAWRLLKFLGLGVFTLGLGGVLLSRDQARRLWSVHGLLTVGLGLTWVAGYGLAKHQGISLGQPWIITGLLASVLVLHEAAAVAQRDRVRAIHVALAVGAYASATGSMVVRLPGPSFVVAALGLPLLLAAITFVAVDRAASEYDFAPAVVGPRTRTWFLWVARAEGLSLLALMGVFMPFKYALGIQLDGGQGWFGWIHGILVFLFMQALWSTWRTLRWSRGRVAWAFVASLVPLGTFVFERSLARDRSP